MIQHATARQIASFAGMQTGDYKNSTCNGDSGGPVYRDFGTGIGYIQVGITSYGPAKCGDPAVADFSATSVFTNVEYYEPWINRVINGGEIPKYHVVTQGSTRQLVENESSQIKASSKVATSGSSGGGSLSLLTIFALGLLSLRRKLGR